MKARRRGDQELLIFFGIKPFYCMLAILLLTSCAPKPFTPIVEHTIINSRAETEALGGRLIRIVQSGDTLYSISFSHGLDVNRLAQWNGVTDTHRLFIGQRIRLTKPVGFKEKVKPTTASVLNVIRVDPVVVSTALPKVVSTPSVPKPEAAKPKVSQEISNIDATWIWPVKGGVIEKFSIAKGQQGIAIEAAARSEVRVTKAGEVVYVGDGLKGYGNLIIVKHSEHFLSAYAHNFTTYVTEGQIIKSKHLIGLIGPDNKRRNALHFQIRKDGKPVNPLSYLPAQ